MKVSPTILKKLILEEVEKLTLANAEGGMLAEVSDDAWDAHKIAINNIQSMSKQMNDDDSYAFLTLLKNWFKLNVLEEQ